MTNSDVSINCTSTELLSAAVQQRSQITNVNLYFDYDSNYDYGIYQFDYTLLTDVKNALSALITVLNGITSDGDYYVGVKAQTDIDVSANTSFNEIVTTGYVPLFILKIEEGVATLVRYCSCDYKQIQSIYDKLDTKLNINQSNLGSGNVLCVGTDDNITGANLGNGVEITVENNSVIINTKNDEDTIIHDDLTGANKVNTEIIATKEYVNAQTSGAIKRSIVTVLPTEDIDENTIYMILKAEGTTNNIYDEYMYISDVWELIGSTSVDLSDYYTKEESNNNFATHTELSSAETNMQDYANRVVSEHNESEVAHADLFNAKVDKEAGKGLSANDFTDDDKSKLDNLSIDDVLSNTSENAIQNKVVKAETTYIQCSVNKFNSNDSDIENGGYYVENNVWSTRTDYSESGYIRVNPTDTFNYGIYTESGIAYHSTLSLIFYDSDKNYVTFKNMALNTTCTVPSNSDIAYMRIPFKTANIKKYVLTVNEDLPTNYVTYCEEKSVKDRVHEIDNELVAFDNNHWKGLNWYAYGTSLTNIDAQGKYAKYVRDASGLVLTNKGISGGGIISNTNVKNAVMNVTDGKTNANLITLECLANDVSATFGTVLDTDGTTFLGALAQCIQYLQENTTAQIVIILSPQARTSTGGTQFIPQYTGTSGLSYADKGEMMQNLCDMYCVPFINTNRAGLGYYRKTDDYYVDNIHHTELGGKVYGDYIWSQLKNIPLWSSEMPI